MVLLTFLEEVKDKASRLIPTAYMEIVEEATAPHLSIPIYEHVMFLCDSANSKPTAVGDIVRALRRRITDDNPAVKHLLVLLLDAMIRNCGSTFHAEMCSQKGILRDLVNLAAAPPTSARGMQAKEAALTLVLNLSIWFAGHPDPACHLLTTLASDVRAVSGPHAFEGIRPDTNTHIRTTAPPSAQEQRQRQQQHQQRAGDKARRQPKDKRNYVDAILIDLPTEAKLAGMLDSCVAFSEYLNNATISPEGDIVYDDVVTGFSSKIEEDHDYVTILLSSNLQIDRDVLRSISDSQSSVLARLNSKQTPVGGAGGGGGPPQVQLPQNASALQPVAVSEDVAPVAPTQGAAAPPRAAVPAASAEVSLSASGAKSQPAPSMDDIFGAPSDGTATTAAAPTASAAPASVSPPQPPAAAAPDAPLPAPPVAAPPAMDDIFGAPQETGPAADASTAPREVEKKEEEESSQPATLPTEAAAVAEPPEPAAPALPDAPPPADAPAPATTTAGGDDDDFDAFLDGKLNK